MEKMNFLYASDDNFAKVLGTSILSLCLNNHKNIDNIFVISQNISEVNKNKLQLITKKFDLEIKFLEMPNFNEIIGEEVDIKRYSASMFSRILIATLLPKEIKRIIYLDCDTMINDNLLNLWNYDLDKKTMGAINDYRSVYYQRNLGIEDKNCYINSGVLLIDVEKYREKKYEEILINTIKKYNGLLEFPDNDAICKVMQNDIKLLPLRYNVISVFYMTNVEELNILRRPNHKIPKEEIENSKNSPAIIHFTTCFLMHGRPWLQRCNHPMISKYLEIYKKTPWNTEKLGEEQLNLKKKIKYSIVKMIPRTFLIFICGIIHSYIKPFMQRKRLKGIQKEQIVNEGAKI